MTTKNATRIATCLLALGAAATTLIIALQIKRAEARSAASAISIAIALPPTWDEIAVTLTRVGLGPEALAACGASPTQTTTLVQNAWTYLTPNIDAIRIAQQSAADTRAQLSALEQLIRSGLASQEQTAQLPLMHAQYNQATADLDGSLAAFFEAVTEPLPPDQRALLTTIHANAIWENAIEFNTIEMTEPQRVELRSALANERISAALDVDPDPADQAVLAQWRSTPQVSAALINAQANLELIKNAWNQAVGVPVG